MNLRTALRWLLEKRVLVGASRINMFDQPDPEPVEDLADWLVGNDTAIVQRAAASRLALVVASGAEVG